MMHCEYSLCSVTQRSRLVPKLWESRQASAGRSYPSRQHTEGPEAAPSLLGEGKKYKSRLLQWHTWAKDLGASDIKALGRCRDIRRGLEKSQGLVFPDSDPCRTFPGMGNG